MRAIRSFADELYYPEGSAARPMAPAMLPFSSAQVLSSIRHLQLLLWD